jgi:hypothetical protein
MGKMNNSYKSSRLFAWLFLSTGIFAIVGSLFTWGRGWLFYQKDLTISLIPLADLIFTAPLSLLAGYGIWAKKSWGIVLGLVTSGVYMFGSVQVYIMVFWKVPPYPLLLVIPPLFGFGIALSFLIWVLKHGHIT